MNKKKIIVLVAFVGFLALNIAAMAKHGLAGVIPALTTGNLWSTTFNVDLVLALSMVMVWMVQDARKHGMSVFPYLLITLTTGSLGPFLYLLRRPESA